MSRCYPVCGWVWCFGSQDLNARVPKSVIFKASIWQNAIQREIQLEWQKKPRLWRLSLRRGRISVWYMSVKVPLRWDLCISRCAANKYCAKLVRSTSTPIFMHVSQINEIRQAGQSTFAYIGDIEIHTSLREYDRQINDRRFRRLNVKQPNSRVWFWFDQSAQHTGKDLG